jgi:hypothetical protein
MHEMQVGVAEPGPGHPDEHLTWTRFRNRDLDEPSGSLPCRKTDCLHRQDVSI